MTAPRPRRVAPGPPPAPAPRVVDVTETERAILTELARDGASNRAIAQRLGLDYRDVLYRLGEMLRRTDYGTRTALALDLVRGKVKLRIVYRWRKGEPR